MAMAPRASEGIPGLVRGLEGVIAAPTAICDLDGVNGRLAYGGYDIADLAETPPSRRSCYLLFYGELPTAPQLEAFRVSWPPTGALPSQLVETMRLSPRTAPLDGRRCGAAVGQCSACYDPGARLPSEAMHRIAMRLPPVCRRSSRHCITAPRRQRPVIPPTARPLHRRQLPATC